MLIYSCVERIGQCRLSSPVTSRHARHSWLTVSVSWASRHASPRSLLRANHTRNHEPFDYFNANHSWQISLHVKFLEISNQPKLNQREFWVQFLRRLCFEDFEVQLTPVSWECLLGGLHFTYPRTTTSFKTFVDSTVFVFTLFSNDYVYETYLTIIIILV